MFHYLCCILNTLSTAALMLLPGAIAETLLAAPGRYESLDDIFLQLLGVFCKLLSVSKNHILILN